MSDAAGANNNATRRARNRALPAVVENANNRRSAGAASRNNRTRRNKMPHVVENTANSRLIHRNASGREINIRSREPLKFHLGEPVVPAPVKFHLGEPVVVEDAPILRPCPPPIPVPTVTEIPRPLFDFRTVYTKDFGKIDLDHEFRSFNTSRFGREDGILRDELSTVLKAVKTHFKKLYFIHVVFQIDTVPRYNTSGSWGGFTPRDYTLYVKLIDSYGNIHTPYVHLPDSHIVTGYAYYREYGHPTVSILKVDEDLIIAEQILLPNKFITQIKQLPKELGTALGGVTFNTGYVSFAVQTARDVNNMYKEIERLTTLTTTLHSSLNDIVRTITEYNILLSSY
jgi:hypothetical protein